MTDAQWWNEMVQAESSWRIGRDARREMNTAAPLPDVAPSQG